MEDTESVPVSKQTPLTTSFPATKKARPSPSPFDRTTVSDDVADTDVEQTPNIELMSVDDVCTWLAAPPLSFEQHVEKFRAFGVDGRSTRPLSLIVFVHVMVMVMMQVINGING